MKILHVTQGYKPAIGGTEWLIQQVSEELVRQYGDEVTVFTTNCYSGEAFSNPRAPRMPAGWEEINGVKVRRFPVRSQVSRAMRLPQYLAYHLGLPGNQRLRAWASGPVIPGLEKAIREQPADVIAASSFPLLHMFAAQRAAEQSGRPCVLHGGLHPQDEWGFDRPMIYAAIRRADRYIANTGFEARYVIERGMDPARVVPVGVGVHPEVFAGIDAQEAKRRLGLEGKTVVGFIGQLGGHKGVDTLLRAMPMVWQAAPDTHFLIAGARARFAEEMEAAIARLPADDQKKILLRYNFAEEEKPWLFFAVDVFAYPSGYESFGIAFLEAWMAARPVIGCWRGAVPWVVHPGRDGLLVKYQNDQMLAEAILALVRNPRWAAGLGAAGKTKALARYTWPEIARRFRQVYQEAAAEKKQSLNNS